MTAGTQVIGLYLIGAARNYSWSNGSAPLFMNGMTNCIKKKRKKKVRVHVLDQTVPVVQHFNA